MIRIQTNPTFFIYSFLETLVARGTGTGIETLTSTRKINNDTWNVKVITRDCSRILNEVYM